MKMFYGNTPIKSMNIKHYEVSTQDATLKPSDMQVGITAYAKGKKVTGTGKAFEFASYGSFRTNMVDFVPVQINVIEIASLDYPVKSSIALNKMGSIDFSTEQIIGFVVIDNIEYPITVVVDNSSITLNCEKTITLQAFLGKDNYI